MSECVLISCQMKWSDQNKTNTYSWNWV